MTQHVPGSLSYLPPYPLVQHVTMAVLHGIHHTEMAELVARMALHGPFLLIAGGEWIPDQNSLRRMVRRHTTRVGEVLDRLKLGRPSTYLQLLDQLKAADAQPYPILITDLLDRFYDPDANIMLRQRILGECCRQIKTLSNNKSLFITIRFIPTKDFHLFLPVLELTANEIIEVKERPLASTLQPPLF